MAITTVERVYTFICQYLDTHGFSPSLREICQACELPMGSVYHHVSRLQRQGRIQRQARIARGITITKR